MAENLVDNSHGKKYAVPRERVFSTFELRPGDHIVFHAGHYWHHGVVAYSNTPGGFIEDNFSSPKTPAKCRTK